MSQVPISSLSNLKALYELHQKGDVEWESKADETAFLNEVRKHQESDGTWKTDPFNKVTIPKPRSINSDILNHVVFENATEKAVFSLTEILTLIHETGQALRKAARETRKSAAESQQAALKDEAKHMKESAKQERKAALVEGWVSIGMGAVSIGSSGAAGFKMLRSTRQTKNLKAQKTDLQVTQANLKSQRTDPSTLTKADVKLQKKLRKDIKKQQEMLQELKAEYKTAKKDGTLDQAKKNRISKEKAAHRSSLKQLRSERDEVKDQLGALKKNKQLRKDLKKNEQEIRALDREMDATINQDVEFSQRVVQFGNALSQFSEGFGKLGSSAHRNKAGLEDAEAKLDAAAASGFEGMRSEAQEFVENAKELLQKTQQTLSEIQQQENSAVSKIWA